MCSIYIDLCRDVHVNLCIRMPHSVRMRQHKCHESDQSDHMWYSEQLLDRTALQLIMAHYQSNFSSARAVARIFGDFYMRTP